MDADGWLRIGEVARRTGLSVRTLRHYDDLGLLVPSERTSGDYRLYSPGDVRRLLNIQHLKSLGLSLPEIADALDDPSFDAAETLQRHIELVRDRLAAERELLQRLTQLDRAAEAGWAEVLDVIALTERLRHPESSVRVRAVLDAPTSLPPETLVGQLASDPSADVREVLTWAAGQQGTALTPLVVGRLDDPDPAVRLQMAHVLSKLGDRSAVGALTARLTDPDPLVAAKAAFALGRLGGPDAAVALAGRLGQADPVQRDAVTSALAQLGPDAVALVSAALGSTDAGVREHAAETLGMLGDPASGPALARLLADPDDDVRFAALLALGHLGGGEAEAAIRGAASSGDERVRLLAARLLADAERRQSSAPGRGPASS
ncbi:MerR family transcriptional regulator [Nigerium massiliense]|uniref:MerR family transcriptional regulator n=1 Tax=Nigerium massiliense TaxID=1522317 RepID=UPI000694FAAB|nr:MerR family transcriptional regulator [Nigerium massiliense]